VKSLSKSLLSLCAVFVCAGALSWAQPADRPLPAALRQLAAASAQRAAWPRLRHYAATARHPELQGLARFVLGYREFQAGDYEDAARDLGECPKEDFSLADYASYYLAAAAMKAGDSQQAASALAGFSTRFPESPLRLRALELRAEALLAIQQPAPALQALTAEPRVRQRPELALLLAQAYDQAQQNLNAARAFQEIYYAFPASPQAKVAAEGLERLRALLGDKFPQATEEIRTARADLLLKAGKAGDALDEYKALLAASPDSDLADRWRLSRARCLLRLRRTSDALQALTPAMAIPASDAGRLTLLVRAYARQNEPSGMLEPLAQLQSLYPQQPARADALFLAGNFFLHQAEWQKAVGYYRVLLESFPESAHARLARWRLAWSYYRAKEQDKAHQAFQDYLARYPDSSQAPAALYWLGRLAEAQGNIAEARTAYELLRRRFVHGYHALQAERRLRRLPRHSAASAKSLPATLDSPIAALAEKIPPPDFSAAPLCIAEDPPALVRPATTLAALSLLELASDYLQATLAEHPASSHVLLALSRLEAKQDNTGRALLTAVRALPDYSQAHFDALPREIWRMLYPRSYWRLVERYARANRLDPYLVMGLIRQESAFNPRATSVADARGLMQILPRTAARSRRASRVRAAGRRLYSPTYNVRFGCAHLRGLMRRYDGKAELALCAYNAGSSRVQSWMDRYSAEEPAEFLESIPFSVTRGYVERVLRDAAVYRELMTGSPSFAACPGEATSRRPRPKAKPRRRR
jgi:soluble lytic murein transglycosylase